jgi:hypothetical protein
MEFRHRPTPVGLLVLRRLGLLVRQLEPLASQVLGPQVLVLLAREQQVVRPSAAQLAAAQLAQVPLQLVEVRLVLEPGPQRLTLRWMRGPCQP